MRRVPPGPRYRCARGSPVCVRTHGSGYAREIVDSARHEDPLVAKPFSTETLLAAVDAVLGPGDEESAASPAEELAPAAV